MPNPSVAALLAQGGLRTHFQPIVDLKRAQVCGHEALVRPPLDGPWPDPDALFAAARQEKIHTDLEAKCVRLALEAWGQGPRQGKLWINLSASAMTALLMNKGFEPLLELARRHGAPLSSVVIELTEHDQVHDLGPIQFGIGLLRREGGSLALDDFGDGRSSLRLWSELRPEYVKIDKYFTSAVHQASHKVKTLKALLQLADTFGSQLVAEGVEKPEELQVLRDIGITLSQGFFLGRPSEDFQKVPDRESLAVIHSSEISVLPEQRHASNRGLTAATLLIQTPTLSPDSSHEEVATLLQRHPALHAVALVEDDIPVGLIGRKDFQDLYLRIYSRELFGRRPCMLHANQTPLCVDLHTPIENLTQVLTSTDQRYLSEGFIITEGGRYRGLGTGEQLVRTVTEARIEAARHANPLTFLPGNIPITLHIERLLESGQDFVACYADLNQFKAFNDHYGYWKGDEMIRLEAECIVTTCDPRRDFVGHVGGDDFVMLLQSQDWAQRTALAVNRFNEKARMLFTPQARQAGGIHAEDRQGIVRFHPCTTLSIGVLRVGPGLFQHADEVASAAAIAKHRAKEARQGIHLMDAREFLSSSTREVLTRVA